MTDLEKYNKLRCKLVALRLNVDNIRNEVSNSNETYEPNEVLDIIDQITDLINGVELYE